MSIYFHANVAIAAQGLSQACFCSQSKLFFCINADLVIGKIMQITVNGQDINITEGTDLITLLTWEKLDPNVVVIELNGQILPAETFANTTLKQGDTLEILHFVGGG